MMKNAVGQVHKQIDQYRTNLVRLQANLRTETTVFTESLVAVFESGA
jgi:hypothetical protein